MEDEDTKPTTSVPKDKADLLARIQREWSALMQTIEKLTPEQMSASGAGGWSVKDNLAHLTAWEQFMLRYRLHRQPPHEAMHLDAASFERLDEDGLNAVLYERHKDRSAEDILTDLRHTHEEVVVTLEQMKFVDLLQPRYGDDPQRRAVLGWVIDNTYKHYQEHRQTIQTMVED